MTRPYHQQNCLKPLRDTRYSQVAARRYRGLKCQRTFRVYPMGVSRAHQSNTLKGLSVLLYALGLSYPGVAALLEALQYLVSKSTVYENVQAAGQRAIELRRQWRQHQCSQVKVLGMDFTHVKCKGADCADDLGLQHQICRAHVNRNVPDLLGTLGEKALEHPDPVPPELQGTGITVDQFLEDLQTVEASSVVCPPMVKYTWSNSSDAISMPVHPPKEPARRCGIGCDA